MLENRMKVQDTVKTLAKYSPKSEFYPSSLASHLNMDDQEVFKYLIEMVELNYLKIIYMLRCNHCDYMKPYDQLNITGDKDNRVYECANCHKDAKASLENVIPRFGFTDEYRKHLKNNKKRRGLRF